MTWPKWEKKHTHAAPSITQHKQKAKRTALAGEKHGCSKQNERIFEQEKHETAQTMTRIIYHGT